MIFKIFLTFTFFFSIYSNAEIVKLESLDFLNKKQEDNNITSLDEDSNKITSLDENKKDSNKINLEFKDLNENIKIIRKENNVDSELDDGTIINNLKEIIVGIDPKFKNAEIKKIDEFKDFYQVRNSKSVIYIHKSGKYILPLIAKVDGKKFEDIQVTKVKDNVKFDLKEFPESSLITYKAKNPVADIFVFSDYTCPFCKKFHKELNNILDMGINIHYIPFPRFGVKDINTINGLKNIICSDNPQDEYGKAFDNSKNYYNMISPDDFNCQGSDSVIHNSLILADKVKVKGTPYIYLSNGTYLGGWSNLSNFKVLINNEILSQIK